MNSMNILSGGAAPGLVGRLAPPFQAETGFDIAGEFGPVRPLARQFPQGRPPPIPLLTPPP